ncbi:MAG: hypothetical protein QXR45_12685 [Candidatus Bathyarchaeia archaeon]
MRSGLAKCYVPPKDVGKVLVKHRMQLARSAIIVKNCFTTYQKDWLRTA